MGKKKYKKQLLKSLKSLGKSEHLLLESMTNLMLLGELKKNNIEFESWIGEKGVPTHRVDGVYQIYFKDPEGYWIEINDAKE